jgi:protein SCO1/2
MRKFACFICLWGLLLMNNAHGHETLDAGGGTGEISVVEKTGQTVPPDLIFYDEKGQKVKLGDLFGKPAILVLVYYTCEHICPQVLGGLSQALPRLAYVPLKDYRVVTVSFDDTDTPQIARNTKKNYMKAAGAAFPEEGWKFLTGRHDSIDRLTEAVGFSYRKDLHGFTHPVVLIFLAPDGKISGYFYVTKFQYGAGYPITFSSFDLNMALTEAGQGKAVTGIKKALLYCFSHEPPGQSKFFNFMAVVGVITLIAMVSFFIYLQVSSRKYREGKEYDVEK